MEIWVGLGSPTHRLGSSQLRVTVLDSHSLVTSFPTPGFAFPREIYWSPHWLVFRGIFPKKHLLEAEIPSPGRHHGTPPLESPKIHPIPVLGLQDGVRDHASGFGGYIWVRWSSWTGLVTQKPGQGWACLCHQSMTRKAHGN